MITILQIGYDKGHLAPRASVLERLGYRVLSAVSNGNAFALASTQRIDLVLIGHCAPIGIRENAASHFKDHFPNIPVIALCSSPLRHDVQYADYSGAVEIQDEWLAAIGKATALRSATAAGD